MLIHSSGTESWLATSATEAGVRDIPLMSKNSTGLRVLVVDDEPLIRWSLAETLTDGGCDVVEAGDGQEALQVLKDTPRPVDVVMLDYRLPDSNNLDLLTLIRARSPGSRIVMMTAYGTPEVAEQAVRLGAYCVVSKPLDMQDVPKLVERAHGSRSA
jgi:two-component system, NtrC family, response regulator AtoC